MSQNRLLTVLYELCSNPLAAGLFLQPVIEQHPEIATAYLRAIKRPLDLGTIVARVRAGCYTTQPERCLRRVRRVFRNCEKFNSTSPHYREAAKHLRLYFDQLWRLFFEWPFHASRSVTTESTRCERELWLRSFIATGSSVPLSTNELKRVKEVINVKTVQHGSTLRVILESIDAHCEAKQRSSQVEHLIALLALRCAERRARGCEFSSAWCAASSVSCTRLTSTWWPVLILDFIGVNISRVPSSIRAKLAKEIRDSPSTKTLVEYLGTHTYGVIRKDALYMHLEEFNAQMKTPKRKQDKELHQLAIQEAHKAQETLSMMYSRGEHDDEVAAKAQNMVFRDHQGNLTKNAPNAAVRKSDTYSDESSSDEDDTGDKPMHELFNPTVVTTGNLKSARQPAAPSNALDRDRLPDDNDNRQQEKQSRIKRQKPASHQYRSGETKEIDYLIDSDVCLVTSKVCMNETATFSQCNNNNVTDGDTSRSVVDSQPRKQYVSQRPKEPSFKASKRERERAVRAAKRESITRHNTATTLDRRQFACVKVRDYLAKLLDSRTLFIRSDRIWKPNSEQRKSIKVYEKIRLKNNVTLPIDSDLNSGQFFPTPLDEESEEIRIRRLHSHHALNDHSYQYVEHQTNPRLADQFNAPRLQIPLYAAGQCRNFPGLSSAEFSRCRRILCRKIGHDAAYTTVHAASTDETDAESESVTEFVEKYDKRPEFRIVKFRLAHEVLELEAIVSRMDRAAAARACAFAKIEELRRLQLESEARGAYIVAPHIGPINDL